MLPTYTHLCLSAGCRLAPGLRSLSLITRAAPGFCTSRCVQLREPGDASDRKRAFLVVLLVLHPPPLISRPGAHHVEGGGGAR